MNEVQSYEAKIRKQQMMLIYSGTGVILFGIWSILQMAVMWYLDREHFISVITVDEEIPIPAYLFERILIITVIVLISLILLARAYIGSCAIREGYGHCKKHKGYIYVAIVFALLMIFSDMSNVVWYFNGEVDGSTLMSAILGLISGTATIEVIISSIKLRILLKNHAG